ncbi:unnamed protein product [Effrenium voratum]|uniref:Uncharacterized protein n=1 Tax=Effrenium voratum TaxID=2562239 RepID=A0AA36NIX8_9DINO|nr:unnamed protein product [Effrenium voratum]
MVPSRQRLRLLAKGQPTRATARGQGASARGRGRGGRGRGAHYPGRALRRPAAKPQGLPLGPRFLCPAYLQVRGVVHFQERVQVLEFSRLLGAGGGVPSEGVSLGLGAKKRTVSETLAPERPGFGKLDQAVPVVPPRKRAHLLQEAMGKDEYAKAQRVHQKEMLFLKRGREKANATGEDFEPMPETLKAARRAAQKLRREVLSLHKDLGGPSPRKPAKKPASRKAPRTGRRPKSAKARK